ncbi:MAG TPA: RbsD/FucU domain-containing protein [Acidobacteriaceae bacterium]|jgi:L-fucose mutarotase|nr:RbsD/FucU domain-containing protein [Acidobacteriaceae bacterium]
MLKTLSVLHTPELLYLLASMGHGDEIAVVDANFPSVSNARRLVRFDSTDLPTVLEACLQLLPLDSFVEEPVARMQQVHAPEEVPEVQMICQGIIDRAEGHAVKVAPISREKFYERARAAFGIVATGELRLYGCIILKKGVIFPRS